MRIWPFRRRPKIYRQGDRLPTGKWVRVWARAACGCYCESNVMVQNPMTAEESINRYLTQIGWPPEHGSAHIKKCLDWLTKRGLTVHTAEPWYIDHEEDHSLPRPRP